MGHLVHAAVAQAVRAKLHTWRGLWRDFTGESAYEHYVERHRREHPDHEPMSEREFWRDRAAFDEDNVSTGCC
ncbi:MAG: YbdD/YjiX family protein [Ancrocorticia sp.]|uniref:YbdD/YjiX family protein n=1 Tax=Ancrocorticia sp. TaxID=2593684 RepID=UPI003F90C655